LLVTSFAARALAVRRVVTNSGKNTAGVDGVIWKKPEEFMKAINDLKNLKKYEASPVLKVYIPKDGTTEIKPLGILTMFDRAVQALFYMALLPISECRVDTRSYGFRPLRRTHDTMTYIWLVLLHVTCHKQVTYFCNHKKLQEVLLARKYTKEN